MAVTDEDLERLKHSFELYNEGQFDAIMDEFAPDVVFERPGGAPPIHGRDALRTLFEPDAFEWQRLEPLDYEIRGDKILMTVKTTSKGAGSSIELELTGWMVITMKEGLAAHILSTQDEQEARELFES